MGNSTSILPFRTPTSPPLAASKNLSPSDLLTLRKRQILATTYTDNIPGRNRRPASTATSVAAGRTLLITPAIAGGMGRSLPDVQSDPKFMDQYSNTETYQKGDIVSYEGNYFMCLFDGTIGTDPIGQLVEQYRDPADPVYSITQAWWSLLTINRVPLGTAPCCS